MTIINTYMRNYFKTVRKNAGFTLIELLVVIGILGVLAAALIATIDPFEQLKKAADANVKNTSVEFVNANVRYYTTHNSMPWIDNTSCAAVAGDTPSSMNLTSLTACMGALISDGELKAGFTTVTGITKEIIVTGGENSVTACFNPKSLAQNHDKSTQYTEGGAVNSPACPVASGISTTCYWCAQ